MAKLKLSININDWEQSFARWAAEIRTYDFATIEDVQTVQDQLDDLEESLTGPFVKADGTTPLTANWDAGSYNIRAQTLQSDVATGTAPFTIASTTLVTNLNSDLLDGFHASDFALASDLADYVRKDGTTDLTGNWTISTNSITLTAGTLTAEHLTSTDDATITDTITVGTLTDSSATLTTGKLTGLDHIDWDTAYTPGSEPESRVWWNGTDYTLNVSTGQGPVLQVGQEAYLPYTMGANESGVQIDDGSVVYLSDDGSKITIELANSRDPDIASRVVGITTENIADGSTGFVTTYGKVRGLDTSSYTLGDILYISPTVDGGLTTTRPTEGDFVIPMAIVTEVNAGDGEIFVRYLDIRDPDDIKNSTGFPEQNAAVKQSDASFADVDRTFRLAPNAGGGYTEYYIWQKGQKYIFDTEQSVVIPDEEGMFWIYFDAGVMDYIKNPTAGETDDLIRNKVLVAAIYWNATDNEAVIIGDERHGHVMSSDTHAFEHFTAGAKWISGLALSDILSNESGDLDTHAQFGVDSGFTTDEDLTNAISAIASTTGLPILYLDGANGDLRRIAETGFSVLTDTTAGVGVTGRLVWNEFTGGAWQLSTITNNDFVLCHVFSTNSKQDPVVAFLGQGDYGNISAARAGANTEISTIITNYPSPELIPIATVIFQTGNGYANAVKGRIRTTDEGEDYVDWRTTALVPGASPSSHPNLATLIWESAGHTSSSASVLAGFDGASAADDVALGTGLDLTASTLTTNDAEIDHDALLNFVADEHVAHTGVTLTAGAGLTGGGDISVSRTFDVGAGTGISVAADAVSTNDSEIVHDNLSGFVANEHIDHTSVTFTAGDGLSGGGDISANRTFDVDMLGLEDLVDPGADRIYFWDDSAGISDWLIVGTNLSITDKTLNASAGGPGDHTTLSNLAWTSSAHTGTVSTFAGFDGAGAATNYTEANYLLAAGTRDLSGDWTISSDSIIHQDNAKSYYGTGSDFSIYHDGTSMIFDVEQTTDEIVFNEGGADTDFRIEGDTDANMFFADAGHTCVGIGTAPDGGAKLHVYDDANRTSAIEVDKQVLQTSGTYYANNFVLTHGAGLSSNYSGTGYGCFGSAKTDPTYTGDITGGLRGGTTFVDHYGSGTIASTFGHVTKIINRDVGTITNAYGFYVDENRNLSTGTITNNYGLYIAPQEEGTNNWAVLVQRGDCVFNDAQGTTDFIVKGDTDANLFFVDGSTDRVGIGTNSPAALFDVDGLSRAETFQSDVATGTAPLTVASTTLVSNLNADLLRGYNIDDLTATYTSASSTSITSTTSTSSTTLISASSVTTTADDRVLIIADCNVSVGTANNYVSLKLFRDSTGLDSDRYLRSPYSNSAGDNHPFLRVHMDQPGAGTFTYSAKWFRVGGGTVYSDNRRIMVMIIRGQT